MADIELTDEQIIEKLKTDSDFGINFTVQNQPNIVIDRLKENGYDLADTPEKAYSTLVKLFKFDAEKVRMILNEIPYDNAVENFTGGFKEYFPTNEPKPSFGLFGEGGVNWGGSLSGLGGVLSGVGSSVGGTTLTTQQQQALLEQQRLIAEEKKRKQTNAIIFAFVGLALLLVVVLMYNKSNKKSK